MGWWGNPARAESSRRSQSVRRAPFPISIWRRLDPPGSPRTSPGYDRHRYARQSHRRDDRARNCGGRWRHRAAPASPHRPARRAAEPARSQVIRAEFRIEIARAHEPDELAAVHIDILPPIDRETEFGKAGGGI